MYNRHTHKKCDLHLGFYWYGFKDDEKSSHLRQ